MVVAKDRSGRQFGPGLVELVCSRREDLFGVVGTVDSWDAVLLLEHQTEPALGTEQLDLALQVGPERRIIDLVEQNVEFASHLDSLFAVHAAVRSRSVQVRRRRQ